jgi:hypothetical protein
VQIPDLPVHTGQNFNGLNIWHWDWGGIPVEDEKTDDGQIVAFAADFLGKKSEEALLPRSRPVPPAFTVVCAAEVLRCAAAGFDQAAGSEGG